MIKKFYSDKAIYTSKDSVNIIVDSKENLDKVKIEIYRLDKLIKEELTEINEGINLIDIGKYNTPFGGFKVLLKYDDKIISTSFTIDDYIKVVRYGFLSDFDKKESDSDIEWMNMLNINYVQFYDWGYKPNKLVASDDIYKDIMGKRIDKNIVKQKIKQCSMYNMKSMAYGPIYAADETYFNLHPEEGYYSKKNKPLTFIEKFFFMNISLKSGWVNNIIDQYKESISKIGFSGIHLDTYGYPKRALDFDGNICYLEDDIPLFLNHVSNELKHNSLIFNNVGAWPLEKTLDFKGDAVYVEVWSPYKTFYNLKEIINKCKESGNAVILSAYIAAFRLDRKNAIYSALLTTFYINSLGSTHLFLGEHGCALTQGYYNDYTKLTEIELSLIQTYEDFFVSHEELLFDDSLVDVSMSNCGGDNEEYLIKGNYSLTSQANKISVTIRCNKKKHLICLLNLEGNNDKWNDSKTEPSMSGQLEFQVQTFSNVNSIYYSTPDMDKPQELEFISLQGDRSNIVKFINPSFKVGMIIWFEEELHVSSNR